MSDSTHDDDEILPRSDVVIVVDEELLSICREIKNQNWSESEWAGHEADDWFQTPNYCGGFDADDEMSGDFAFAIHSSTDAELWFMFKLQDVDQILAGEITQLPAYDPL